MNKGLDKDAIVNMLNDLRAQSKIDRYVILGSNKEAIDIVKEMGLPNVETKLINNVYVDDNKLYILPIPTIVERIVYLREPVKCDYDDVYFKFHCLYNAKTEMYDRTLTDQRDRYDPTSAYIAQPWERRCSNKYAFDLHRQCRNKIMSITKKAFSYKTWKKCISKYYGLSAQGWIDLYNNLVEKGAYDEFE